MLFYSVMFESFRGGRGGGGKGGGGKGGGGKGGGGGGIHKRGTRPTYDSSGNASEEWITCDRIYKSYAVFDRNAKKTQSNLKLMCARPKSGKLCKHPYIHIPVKGSKKCGKIKGKHKCKTDKGEKEVKDILGVKYCVTGYKDNKCRKDEINKVDNNNKALCVFVGSQAAPIFSSAAPIFSSEPPLTI